MKSSDALWKNYDLENLSQLSLRWPYLDRREGLACIIGKVCSREPFEKTSAFMYQHKEQLERWKLWDICLLFLNFENQEEISDELYNVLLNVDGYTDSDPYIRGEHLVGIALAFFKLRQFQLSQKYHQAAARSFKEANINTLVWRSKMNYSLGFLRQGDIDSFQKEWSQLETEYHAFTEKAQIYCARFCLWIYIYLGDMKKANELLSKWIPSKCEFKITPPQSYLLKYRAFLLARDRDQTNWEKTIRNMIKLQAKEKDIKFIQAIIDILDDSRLSRSALKRLLEEWKTKFGALDLLMLADIYLNHLMRSKNFKALRQSYEEIDLFVIQLNYFIPHTELQVYGLVAYKDLGVTRNFSKLLNSFEKDSPNWKWQQTQKLFESYQKFIDSHEVVFDLQGLQLRSGEIYIGLARRPALSKLLSTLSQKSKMPLNEAKKVVRVYSQTEDVYRSLCRKIQNINRELRCEFLVIHNNFLMISSKVIFRTFLQKQQPKYRLSKIVKHMESATSVSIKDLEALTGISRRTLFRDLSHLVKEGKIEPTGNGRTRKYKYVKN